MSREIYNLHYSRLLGVPILNRVLYSIEKVLIQCGFRHIWVSKQAIKQREELFNHLAKNAQHIYCTAWRLGTQLSPLWAKYIFEYTGAPVSSLSLEELYDVQWSLILAASVSSKSVPLLGELLPRSVPLWTKYIVSVHQRLDIQCDFVKQTIEELVRRGNSVCIYSHVQQPADIQKKYAALGVHLIETVRPLRWKWLPYTVEHQIGRVWQRILQTKLNRFVGDAEAVFWSFDPDDAQITSQLPLRYLVVYDCVDFYTSADPVVKKQIAVHQHQLLSRADVFSVNSRTLFKLHKNERKDVFLVPQGFDEHTFLNTTHKEKRKGLFDRLSRQQKKFAYTVTFAGVLSHRVAYPLLYSLIQSHPKVLFCLPQTLLPWDTEDRHNWQHHLEPLKTLTNIFWYPRLQRDGVRTLLEMSDVGLIPYDVSQPFNKYCFPMKLFEHLSVGIPTLSTPIEELKYYPDYVKVGSTAEELSKKLQELLRKPLSQKTKQEMLALSRQQSWSNKVGAILEKIQPVQSANVATRHSLRTSRQD